MLPSESSQEGWLRVGNRVPCGFQSSFDPPTFQSVLTWRFSSPMKEGGETLERGPKGPRERVSEESPIPGPAYVPYWKPGPGSRGWRHNRASVCSWPVLGHSGHGQSGLRKGSAGKFKTGEAATPGHPEPTFLATGLCPTPWCLVLQFKNLLPYFLFQKLS